MLSTDWPSPDRPDLVGTIAVGLALTTAIAAELARRTRLHLAPLVPVLLGHIGVIALSAPTGLRLRWIAPLAVLAIMLAALRPGAGIALRERLMLLRGERRLVPVSLLAIGLAAGLAGPIVLNDRADPRRNEPADRAASLLDPIEATLALQAIDPPIDLHEIQIEEFGPGVGDRNPVRWRTAALVRYDGRLWSPELTLRPIGRRLGPPADDTVTASVTFLNDDLQLVPLPGAAVTIDSSIETDPDRTVVRLADRASLDREIAFTSRIEPSIAESDPGRIGTREIDENSIGFTELASALVDEGGSSPSENLLDQLRAIESAMNQDFVLRSDASGGVSSGRSSTDSCATPSAATPNSSRPASCCSSVPSASTPASPPGSRSTPSRIDRVDGTASLTLSSADARIWPEVRIGDGWVAFDPVPLDEDTDAEPPPPEPQVQTPAAPQPPIAPPPESADEPVVTEDEADTNAAEAFRRSSRSPSASLRGVGALLIPIVLVVALIMGLKWRHRRRRLAGSAPERIHGAWGGRDGSTGRRRDDDRPVGHQRRDRHRRGGARAHGTSRASTPGNAGECDEIR